MISNNFWNYIVRHVIQSQRHYLPGYISTNYVH
jgi:hypothetical protein